MEGQRPILVQAARAGRRRLRRRSGGALLLDAMLTLVASTLILLASAALIIGATSSADAARRNNVGYNAARQVIENIRQNKQAAITVGEYDTDLGGATPVLFGPVPQLSELVGGAAHVSVTDYYERVTTTVGGVPTVQLVARKPVKVVTVTVTWRAGARGGSPRKRVLTTLVGPGGVTP
jgi:hypothetical protein